MTEQSLSFLGTDLVAVPLSTHPRWEGEVTSASSVEVQQDGHEFFAFLYIRECQVAIGHGSTPEGALHDLEMSIEEQADSLVSLASKAKKARHERYAKAPK